MLSANFWQPVARMCSGMQERAEVKGEEGFSG